MFKYIDYSKISFPSHNKLILGLWSLQLFYLMHSAVTTTTITATTTTTTH